MAASMSKEEYLKRYLSGGESGDKKKKKKKRKPNTSHGSGLKIIDEDVDLKSLLPGGANNLQEEDDDETPTVAEFVDERPQHVIEMEEYRKNTKWKVLTNQGNKTSSRGTESDDDDEFSNRDVRKQRHDSESDQSPPRKLRHDSESDQSPPRKQRHDSDSDQSPPRKQRHDSDSDQSPPRKQRHDSDSDQSPPRKQRHDSNQSPERKQRHNARRKRWDSPKSDTLSNNSSKRENKRDQKKNSRWNSPGSDSDQSPPRKHRKHSPASSRSSHSREDSNRGSRKPGDRETAKGTDDKGRATKTLAGATAGLSSAKAMRQEAQKLRDKEDAAFTQIDAELLGRNAKTVFRDKSGRKRNLQQEGEEDSKKAQEQAERNKQYQIWGKGLTQQARQEEQVEVALHEANKPLARYKDDEDLDTMLRNQDREGDPMLAFLKKKKTNSKEKKKELPKYKGPAPPMNRFGIQPGYRWDGVNRSNGFEKKLFTKQADRKATEMMAYKWSIEDM